MSRTPKIETLICTTVTKRKTLKLDATVLCEALVSLHSTLGIPKDARVYFHVPSGGDYSGMALDIDSDCPVWVEWTEETVEDTRS